MLEADIKERPAATISERRHFLWSAMGKSLSLSTMKRLLKRLVFSRKNGLWGRWSETSPEGLPGGWVSERVEPERFVFVDEMGANISLSPLRA